MADSLEQRMKARINAKLPPPPEDWVEPQTAPPEPGQQAYTAMTPADWTTLLLSPGITGKPE